MDEKIEARQAHFGDNMENKDQEKQLLKRRSDPWRVYRQERRIRVFVDNVPIKWSF